MTYTPGVGHLVRHHTSSPFRTVLFAGATESCVSRRDDHRRPHVVWANTSMIRMCPDCSQDWGDGETCQHCAPPAPAWTPHRGSWALDAVRHTLTVLQYVPSVGMVNAWNHDLGRLTTHRLADLRIDPADPKRSNQ